MQHIERVNVVLIRTEAYWKARLTPCPVIEALSLSTDVRCWHMQKLVAMGIALDRPLETDYRKYPQSIRALRAARIPQN